MATPAGNPKDSLKSTWHGSKSDWGLAHHLFDILALDRGHPAQAAPKHAKKEPVPYLPEWQTHRYVLIYSFLPLIVHQAYVQFTGHNLGMLAAFIYYSLWYKIIGIRLFHTLDGLGQTLGYLDGDKHGRDRVPDVGVNKVMISLISTSTFRAMFSVMLSYRKSQTPIEMNWLWLPVEIGAYSLVLDFWFYWYHRLMHETDSLWKYHRTHHLTKHPSPLLTLYADHEQEFFDIAGIPLLTYFSLKLMGMPMGFFEWWVCHQYIVFTELSGHSGLRMHAGPPSTISWLLRLVGGDLVIEDHDLHHRKGWKSSGNYGKQTRFWDLVFGTFLDRVECTPDNIDYKNAVQWPVF